MGALAKLSCKLSTREPKRLFDASRTHDTSVHIRTTNYVLEKQLKCHLRAGHSSIFLWRAGTRANTSLLAVNSHCSGCRWPAAAGPSSAAGLLTPLSLPVRCDPEDGGRNPPKWKPGDGGDSTAGAVTRQVPAQHYFPSPARWTSTYIFALSHMGWEMRALCWPSPAACSAL